MNINCVTASPTVKLRLQRVPHLEGNSLILDLLPDLLFPPLSKSLPLGMKDFTVLLSKTSAIKTHRLEKHPPPFCCVFFDRAFVTRRTKHVRDPYHHHHRIFAFLNISLSNILLFTGRLFFFLCVQFNSHVTPAMDPLRLSTKKKPKTQQGCGRPSALCRKQKSLPENRHFQRHC